MHSGGTASLGSVSKSMVCFANTVKPVGRRTTSHCGSKIFIYAPCTGVRPHRLSRHKQSSVLSYSSRVYRDTTARVVKRKRVQVQL